MDQNDLALEQGEPALRRIYQIESAGGDIQHLSLACRHCDLSPCVTGCPTGALARDPATGAVVINRDICIGCHSCAVACPFGVPRYDRHDKVFKCTLCNERVHAGLKPACVRTCPMEALSFAESNETQYGKESTIARNLSARGE
jgi:Fe-S-cluster-containing dehydrogenase component